MTNIKCTKSATAQLEPNLELHRATHGIRVHWVHRKSAGKRNICSCGEIFQPNVWDKGKACIYLMPVPKANKIIMEPWLITGATVQFLVSPATTQIARSFCFPVVFQFLYLAGILPIPTLAHIPMFHTTVSRIGPKTAMWKVEANST